VTALQLDGVWKAYPRWTASGRTVRSMLSKRVPALGAGGDQRWALRDVTLSVAPGESVGLIGQNGAGKSTLLRLAAGLSRPTRGALSLPADTASVLTLGESFDLNLTGSENALTAAMVGGLRRAAARARIAAIIEFAELESFADAPMRTYSEGMKLRLAFGVVAQVQPDALLLDEVIAVGDLRFQRKCMNRIQEMKEAGAAVLFASHALDQVTSECERAVWLEAGAVRAVGESAAVIAEYEEAMRSATIERTPAPEGDQPDGLELRRNRFGTQELTLEDVVLKDADGESATEIATGRPLAVSMRLENHGAPVVDPIVLVTVHRVADGVVCFTTTTENDGVGLGRVTGGRQVSVVLDRVDLVPGEYMVDIGVYESGWAYAYDLHWQAYPLRVRGQSAPGVVRPASRWSVG
jgi:lipopolysaccharide transport system ATP-binding protein